MSGWLFLAYFAEQALDAIVSQNAAGGAGHSGEYIFLGRFDGGLLRQLSLCLKVACESLTDREDCDQGNYSAFHCLLRKT